MGGLSWRISKSERLVVIRGVGVFNLAFMTSFREAMRAQGAAGYSKLFDLSRADPAARIVAIMGETAVARDRK